LYRSRPKATRIPREQLADHRSGDLSAAVRERVERARATQTRQFGDTPPLANADKGPKELRWKALDVGLTVRLIHP
jgi:hypothetical protein